MNYNNNISRLLLKKKHNNNLVNRRTPSIRNITFSKTLPKVQNKNIPPIISIQPLIPNISNYSNNNLRRQRGIRNRRRGVKILVRNLTRNATNLDIKYLFERIGPLKRCGINWNNLGESKGTAEVEYLYRRDAFKACKELDYKSIRGVPIRLEIRDGPKRILLNRRDRDRDNNRNRSARRFRSRSRDYHRNNNDSRRRFSRRISNRRGSRRREENSRSDRRYRKY